MCSGTFLHNVTAYKTQVNLSHTVCLSQFVSQNLCHTMCLTQFVSHNVSHTICLTQFVSDNVSHTICLTQFVSHNVSHNLSHTICLNVSHTICLTQFVSHNVSHTICLTQFVSHNLSSTGDSFASLSTNSFPSIPACPFTQPKCTIHFKCNNAISFFLICSNKRFRLNLFCNKSNVILLSLYTAARLSLFFTS